jgi:hypothetical protein
VLCVDEKSQIQALDRTTGQIIGTLRSRHRAIEFKTFLATIDREVPDELDIHVVLDNSSPTRRRPSRTGWPPIPGSCCTSPRPRARGSTWSSAGSASRRPKAPPRRTPLRRSAQHRHPRLDRTLQPGPQAVRLDQNHRPNPRIH